MREVRIMRPGTRIVWRRDQQHRVTENATRLVCGLSHAFTRLVGHLSRHIYVDGQAPGLFHFHEAKSRRRCSLLEGTVTKFVRTAGSGVRS
jgi:hypothetical protein